MYIRVTATNTETSELLFDWSNLSRVNVVIDSPLEESEHEVSVKRCLPLSRTK